MRHLITFFRRHSDKFLGLGIGFALATIALLIALGVSLLLKPAPVDIATVWEPPSARATDAPGVPPDEDISPGDAPSPTSEMEAPPVDAYPYIRNITERSHEIFREGQALGNRYNVFSKVGDSITATEGFLVPIGTGDYDLHEHTYLASVIGFFSTVYARNSNSYANTSLAAGAGWTAGQVLSIDVANPNLCEAGENALLCEYRIVRPSVALIMLGTNDVLLTTSEDYEAAMRGIIEATIEQGIIPVLSTIPPVHVPGYDTRPLEFNGVLIRLSNEYEIPLWDYYSALQGLPDDGLWADGVHPGWVEAANFDAENLQYGMTVRNFTALQVLDAIMREVILPERAGG